MQNQTQNPPNPEGKRNSSVPSFTQSLQRCLNLFLNNFFTTNPFKTSNKIFILLFITSCIVDPKFWFNDFIISSDYAYALAYQVDTGVHDTTWRYFLKWNGSDWQIEEYYLQIVGFVPKFGSISLALINGELYSCGNGIFKYINNQWQKVLTDVYNRNFYDIYGNSRNNIFAVGSRNMVYHYNGFDWKMLEEFPYSNLICSSVWTDGNEVFIVARDGNRTYIYHGK